MIFAGAKYTEVVGCRYGIRRYRISLAVRERLTGHLQELFPDRLAALMAEGAA